MQGVRRTHRSRRKNKSVRWMVLAIVLCSAMSCIAPVLYASSDCSRWLAEYKQGILQRRAARRLRAAKFRLVAMVHKQAPVHPHPMRHRLSPLESLRRFEIDCGDLEAPVPPNEAVVPPMPLVPVVALLNFEAPPDLLPPAEPALSVTPSSVPPLINVPITPVDIATVNSPLPTPEPGSFLLVLTGAGIAAELIRRRSKSKDGLPVPAI